MTERPTEFELSPGTRRQFLRTAGITGGLLLTGDILAACGGDSEESADSASETPARGGALRVGVLGGSSADTLDANSGLTYPDTARGIALYDTLARYDEDLNIEMSLAESMEPNGDASEWTIRLKPDITFHNGKTLDADDVIFTFTRIIEGNLVGAAGLAAVDLGNIRKLDSRTLRLKLRKPFVTLLPVSTQIASQIVPVGYDAKAPVGTGPFKFKSFTPGKQSSFVRNPDFRDDRRPYLDELIIIDFTDDSARLNALLGGTVDMIDQVAPSQRATIQGNGEFSLSETETAQWTPFVMRVDAAPFDDVQVRQAMRLLIDRPQMITQATGEAATLGNDIFGKLFPGYDESIAQREQDLDQARSLLKAAGQEDLSVELITSPVATNLVQAAQVLSEQASDAGVTIEVKELNPTDFFAGYTTWPFTQDFIFGLDYLLAASYTQVPGAVLGTTHFENAKYTKLYDEANALIEEARRNEVLAEMQRIDYEQGGYIIPYFPNTIDAYSKNVTGLLQAKTGVPLGNYRFDVVGFRA